MASACFFYFISSTSGNTQLLSIIALPNPYNRNMISKCSPDLVGIQLDCLPSGALGPKYMSTVPSVNIDLLVLLREQAICKILIRRVDYYLYHGLQRNRVG